MGTPEGHLTETEGSKLRRTDEPCKQVGERTVPATGRIYAKLQVGWRSREVGRFGSQKGEFRFDETGQGKPLQALSRVRPPKSGVEATQLHQMRVGYYPVN